MLSETETIRLNEIMIQFDFEKVHNCMTLMNWTWVSSKTLNRVPSLEELKNTAERLLNNAITSYLRNSFSGNISTGGFEASYNYPNDTLELKFILTEWEDSYIKEEPKYKAAKEREKRKIVIKNLLDGK